MTKISCVSLGVVLGFAWGLMPRQGKAGFIEEGPHVGYAMLSSSEDRAFVKQGVKFCHHLIFHIKTFRTGTYKRVSGDLLKQSYVKYNPHFKSNHPSLDMMGFMKVVKNKTLQSYKGSWYSKKLIYAVRLRDFNPDFSLTQYPRKTAPFLKAFGKLERLMLPLISIQSYGKEKDLLPRVFTVLSHLSRLRALEIKAAGISKEQQLILSLQALEKGFPKLESLTVRINARTGWKGLEPGSLEGLASKLKRFEMVEIPGEYGGDDRSIFTRSLLRELQALSPVLHAKEGYNATQYLDYIGSIQSLSVGGDQEFYWSDNGVERLCQLFHGASPKMEALESLSVAAFDFVGENATRLLQRWKEFPFFHKLKSFSYIGEISVLGCFSENPSFRSQALGITAYRDEKKLLGKNDEDILYRFIALSKDSLKNLSLAQNFRGQPIAASGTEVVFSSDFFNQLFQTPLRITHFSNGIFFNEDLLPCLKEIVHWEELKEVSLSVANNALVIKTLELLKQIGEQRGLSKLRTFKVSFCEILPGFNLPRIHKEDFKCFPRFVFFGLYKSTGVLEQYVKLKPLAKINP